MAPDNPSHTGPSPAEGEGSTAATKRTIEAPQTGPAEELRRILADATVDHGYYVVRPALVDSARLTLAAYDREHVRPAMWQTFEGRPPEQLLEFVGWKLQIAMDSFYGRVLQLVAHADRPNRAALRRAFPVLVDAWQAWQECDGDFELTPDMARFVEGGDVR